MLHEIGPLLQQNQQLVFEKDELVRKLNEANDVIEGIKKGDIDAVFISKNGTSNVLVSREADQTYRRFIENMSEGVVALHTDGIIMYCNASFADMVDLPIESLIGTDFRKVIPAETIDEFQRFFKVDLLQNIKLELSR